MPSNNPKPKQAAEKPGVSARRVAVRLMTAVTEDRALLSDVLAEHLDDLPPDERARAQRLATEALRWSPRCDRLLGPYLRYKPEDPVLNTLRLAVWEVFAAGTPPHGVVDSAVALTRGIAPGKAKMVNAVLRNVLRSEPDWPSLPPPSLPKWLRKRFLAVYGKEVVTAIEAAHAAGAPLDLTPKSMSAAAVAAAVGGTALPTGSVRVTSPVQVTALPGFDSGDWWVQDVAAAIPARILAARPGEAVLDLCAAPGGKTMQLAATGARVTALDVSASRMARVSRNLERTGLSAHLVVADALTWNPALLFDAVLLDAPCSATGTIRRHPDLPYAKAGLDLAPLCSLQAQLFDRALEVLRPGGRLVFCTCSLLPEEGEAQLAEVLKRHPGLRVLRDTAAGVEPGWRSPEGGLRLRPDFWPERGGMDGFYIAAVQKPL